MYQQKSSQQIPWFPQACRQTPAFFLEAVYAVRLATVCRAYLSVPSALASAADASSAWLRLKAAVALCVSRRTCTGCRH